MSGLGLVDFLVRRPAKAVGLRTPTSPRHDDDPGGRQFVDALMRRMTVEEKIGQLIAQSPPTDPVRLDLFRKAVANGSIGNILFVADPAQTNALQRSAITRSRLGIPILFGFDVIHGLRTIFPVPIALAASWSPSLVEDVQRVAAREARAVGIHQCYSPMVDIARDPRWGRIVEGAGEDPYLGAAMARAQVVGLQGDRVGAPEHVVACVKHFTGYGAGLGGRDYDEVDLSESALWNTYLPPFEAAIGAGAGGVMSAYTPLNGVPATGNAWLLTKVLRDSWHFDGIVISDNNAVKDLVDHGFAADRSDAAARALDAGVTMEMTDNDPAFATLKDDLASGRITMGLLDAAVRRVLDLKFRMGLFDDPYVDPSRAATTLARPDHVEQARSAAEKSFVLLKNDDSLLPLDRTTIKRIAVIGPLADAPREMLGPWVFDQAIERAVSPLKGIAAKAGDRVRVDFAYGVRIPERKPPSPFAPLAGANPLPAFGDERHEFEKAVALARASDVAILVVGETQDMSGEVASRASLDLPGRQLELVKAIAETGRPTILLLMSARPNDISAIVSSIPAIVQVWYPGEQGGNAIANLLFGDATPGGKLPYSWPRDIGQVPMIYSRLNSMHPNTLDDPYQDMPSAPLFPFGHGLTYSDVELSGLRLSRNRIPVSDAVTVSVDVRNAGPLPAEPVVQLYIHQRYGSAARPARELKGFRRIRLPRGASQTVEFTLTAHDRRYWSEAAHGWTTEAADFDVFVGLDSQATQHISFATYA